MVKGQPDRASIGTTVTTIGAILLTCAIAVLVYGLSTAHCERPLFPVLFACGPSVT
jgi:hypothetical protein